MTGAGGDRRRVFDALFRENIAGIAAYCRRHSRSPGEVDDAVAEVFMIAWRRLDDVPAGTAARAWLYGTARRVMANQHRATARRGRLREKLSAQPVTPRRKQGILLPIASMTHSPPSAHATARCCCLPSGRG